MGQVRSLSDRYDELVTALASISFEETGVTPEYWELKEALDKVLEIYTRLSTPTSASRRHRQRPGYMLRSSGRKHRVRRWYYYRRSGRENEWIQFSEDYSGVEGFW